MVKINMVPTAWTGQSVTLGCFNDCHKDYYKVIYFGGIMGAVKQINEDWELMDPQEVDAGNLPQYITDLKGERLEIVLEEHTVDAIGSEIEHYNSDDEE